MATRSRRKTKKRRSNDDRVFIGIILFFAAMILLLVIFVSCGDGDEDISEPNSESIIEESNAENITEDGIGSEDITDVFSESISESTSEIEEDSSSDNDTGSNSESENSTDEDSSADGNGSDVTDETSGDNGNAEGQTWGWTEKDGKRYYHDADGKIYIGKFEIDGKIYIFGEDGAMKSGGWTDYNGEHYYLNPDGSAYIGWLESDGSEYYLQNDGTAAQGEKEIDGKKYFFSEKGKSFIVVNPWNYIPEGFEPDLVDLPKAYGDSEQVDRSCYDALIKMMEDCEKAGHDVFVVSSYRTHEFQTYNFNRKVKQYLAQGYSQKDAEAAAAGWVAVPGTSEHQLGLAVDIIDTDVWELTDVQAGLDGQKWLMENCWKYGFILRYPKDTKSETGINYEPWHYRYFGTEIAEELHESGMTVEAYLASLAD